MSLLNVERCCFTETGAQECRLCLIPFWFHTPNSLYSQFFCPSQSNSLLESKWAADVTVSGCDWLAAAAHSADAIWQESTHTHAVICRNGSQVHWPDLLQDPCICFLLFSPSSRHFIPRSLFLSASSVTCLSVYFSSVLFFLTWLLTAWGALITHLEQIEPCCVSAMFSPALMSYHCFTV